MRRAPPELVHDMDEIEVAPPADAPEHVPVLVPLGDEDVPVCEDGSCAL
jgi:hypothetical protein